MKVNERTRIMAMVDGVRVMSVHNAEMQMQDPGPGSEKQPNPGPSLQHSLNKRTQSAMPCPAMHLGGTVGICF